MFAFVALMIDKDIFKTVEINFLIVGHTHASIDQYFSVLSKQIKGCDFIGSPLSLEALLGQDRPVNLSGNAWARRRDDHCGMHSRPLRVRKLSIIYDMKTCLQPIVNMGIKYYPIPHCFRFEKYRGVSAMRYSVFSGSPLLPERPVRFSGNKCATHDTPTILSFRCFTCQCLCFYRIRS